MALAVQSVDGDHDVGCLDHRAGRFPYRQTRTVTGGLGDDRNHLDSVGQAEDHFHVHRAGMDLLNRTLEDVSGAEIYVCLLVVS